VIIVRDARLDDAAGIAFVHVETWRTAYGRLLPKAFLAALSVEERARLWRRRLDPATAAGQVAVVAAKNGRIVGFAAGCQCRSDDDGYDAECYALYVLETHQGQGLGRRLLGEVARRLGDRGYSSLLVWVLADGPARGFYEALGGRFVRSQTIEIGRVRLEERAYGWSDLDALAGDTLRRLSG